jgi:hypothetical protein
LQGLSNLPFELGKGAIYAALGGAGRVVRDAAIARAPALDGSDPKVKAGYRKSGTLKRAIRVSRSKKNKGQNGMWEVIVGVKPLKQAARQKFKKATGLAGAQNPDEPGELPQPLAAGDSVQALVTVPEAAAAVPLEAYVRRARLVPEEQWREIAPPSVTEKEQAPPSGDRHDYMSLAPYFWPDPTKPGGRPYVRRDGERNPESRDPRANDGPRIAKMGNAIETLSLAYFFTGDKKYATHAADMARVWFIAPATRMNPNFT